MTPNFGNGNGSARMVGGYGKELRRRMGGERAKKKRGKGRRA